MNEKITLEIPQTEIPHLVNVYENLLNKLDKDREDASGMLTYLKSLVAPNRNTNNLFYSVENKSPVKSSEIVKLPNGYIKQWPWNKKIVFVLKEANKKMTAREIGEYIFEKLEPEARVESKKILSTISGQISLMFTKSKTLNREKNELDDYVYEVA